MQTVRKAGCVESELLNRHIKQVKAEKNRNGRISDNGSNLSNKLPDRISGRVIRLVEKYIHLGNPNQPLSSRYSFGDFPVILLKYLPKKDCDGKCKESQTC